MANNLPSPPYLYHLRRQAKKLLADLLAGDPQSIATLQEHLPSARGMTADKIHAANLIFELRDSFICRFDVINGK